MMMKKILKNLQPNSNGLVKLFPVTLLPNAVRFFEVLQGTVIRNQQTIIMMQVSIYELPAHCYLYILCFGAWRVLILICFSFLLQFCFDFFTLDLLAIYGLIRHRWTGRFEAHLWDKNCWNESQNKKGRQGN